MSSSHERIGHNEALSREINERIEAGRWPGEDESPAFLCECARLGCNVLVELTIGEYEHIRADARRFVLAPGHELPETEFVVERHPAYVVVEKQGVAGTVAEESDPRAN